MLGEFGHAVSLGEVLSDEAVGVLVGTSFPGMMGISEVESGVGEALDVLIAMEFGSVVGGSVLDGPLASQSSPGVVGAVSLAPLLGCTPQVSMKGAAPALVVPDVPIDGLMADLEPPVERQSSGDLLGAPILHPDQELDESPIPIGESEVPSGM